MKKKVFIFATLFFFVLTSHQAFASSKVVCLDPGHGGSDTGATMTGVHGTITEAQITLDIANRLSVLLSPIYTVVMTRTDMNSDPTNSERATICNNAGASILVSIHLNGSTNHSIDYTEGLYGKKNKDFSFAQTVNQAMNLGIPNNGITNFADGILIKSAMPATLAETVFITSTNEYALLTDGTGNRQQLIAQALDTGIINWLH